MADPGWVRVAALRNPEAFRRHLEGGGISLAFDDALAAPSDSPFARPLEADGLRAGNRFCVLPMEGWDGTADGHPTELTRRRWRNFGLSGAKLIWGGEAAAVRHDGRANPCQLVVGGATWESLARLRDDLVAAHEAAFGLGAANDLVVGLQITHSGRYARPNAWDRAEPLVAFAHPVLDRRFPGGVRILTDEDLDRLADDYVQAAVLARRAGFQFVDVKHCHGYLGHELLAAHDRPGRYGGSLENRTRLLRTIVDGIRAEAPGLRIGVRFSAFDTVPWRKGPSGRGEPEQGDAGYTSAFGLLHDERMDEALGESRALLRLLHGLGIRWVCVSAGSPYYNPHVQRPALFPPSDGYLPPEDPLVGVARQIRATALLKSGLPGHGAGGLRLQLPAGVAAERRPARGARGPGRLRRPRPHGPLLPGPAGGRTGRPAARAQEDLPDLQRLHDGPAQGAPLGMLSSRPVLRRTAGGRSAEGSQGSSPAGMTSETPDASRQRNQGLAVATAFFALFSIVGFAYYGLPFFYDFFVRELGWSRAQVTSGNAFAKLVIGPLFGFFAGVVVDRFGPRKLMLVGVLLAGLAPIGLGGTTTLLAFYAFYLMNALGYVTGGPLPNQVMLSRWFDAGRGRAMGIAYLGIGVGGALVPLLAHALTEALGWRTALRILGVLMIAIAFPLVFFVREPEADGGRAVVPVPPAAGAGGTDSILDVLRQPAFYLLALGSMASIGAVGGTSQNLKLYFAMDRGMAQGRAAELMSLVLVGSIAGRLLMGWLADRWPRKRVMLLIYLIVAGSIPLLWAAPSPVTLRAAAVVFGIGLGGDYMIIPLMAADLFGLKRMGRVMGIVLTADGVAEAVVPMAVATLRDRTGGYGPGFALLVALAILGALAVSMLPVYKWPRNGQN